jgi:molecular chaperone GrpE
MSQKGSHEKNNAARPFVVADGEGGAPHGGPDAIMEVGAEAMIDDKGTATPDAGAGTGNAGGDDRPDLAAAFAPEEADAPAGPEAFGPEPPEDIEAIKAERDSYLDMARRERADFDNYRKRMERDMAQIKRESLARFLKEFFTPLDDMDRVLQECEKNHSFESLVTGVRIMEENFWRVLAKIGVRKIDAKGKPFDPGLHEAMAMVPSGDVPPNTVLEVYEAGYKLDEFILRPARVVVSRAPDA